jgi:hypothetical protein
MFNLEQSIVEWRKQMLAAGIQSPAPLEELEIHLREEIEQRMRSESNLNEEGAFNFAVRKIGQSEIIKTEFKKIERGTMKPIMIILAALFGTVFGGAMILPALGRWHHAGYFCSIHFRPEPFWLLSAPVFYFLASEHTVKCAGGN